MIQEDEGQVIATLLLDNLAAMDVIICVVSIGITASGEFMHFAYT